MPINLGVKEAADRIRHYVSEATLPPEASHQLKFLQGVCSELGVDGSIPENLHRVAMALKHHDIAIHSGDEFPMHVTRLWDGSDHIVNSAEEAEAKINEPEPPPPAKPDPTRYSGEGTILGEKHPAEDSLLADDKPALTGSDTVEFEQDSGNTAAGSTPVPPNKFGNDHADADKASTGGKTKRPT